MKFIADRKIQREVLVEILVGLRVAAGGRQVAVIEVGR
jgi:hypothetical protein